MISKNLAQAIVLTAPSPATSGTSVVVRSGEGAYFDSTPPFLATAAPPDQLANPGYAEIVLVTAISTDTLTIVRAKRSTTAKSIAAGWVIANGIYTENVFGVNVTVSTAAATATKVGTTTAGDYTPTLGDIVNVTFSNGNTVTTPTLNIDSSGAKNIRLGNANVTTAFFNTGSAITLQLWYDGTYYQLYGSLLNTDTTYSEISQAEITNTASTTTRLITGRRAEDLMVNEATKTRTLTNKTLTNPLVNKILDTNGNSAMLFNATANAVNYAWFVNGATGNSVSMRANGSDTNISFALFSKGSGQVQLRSDTNGFILTGNSVASGVNYLNVTSSIAGASPFMSAVGSDTNLDLNLVPKGTGNVTANGVPVVSTTGTQTLTSKTLTSPVINTSVSGTAILDEDNMASDSATQLATQQSIKAYVDNKAGVNSLIRNEVPGGSVNSSNVTFTLASTPASGSLRLYKNGVRLKITDDYTISGLTITMVSAPATGTKLLADYETTSSVYSVGTNSIIVGEVPSGSVNGSNATFTLARAYIAGSLEVMINGIAQARTTHFTETTPASGIFTMGDAPLTGDIITVNYQYNLNPSSNADTVDGIHANATATANQLFPLDSNAKLPNTITNTTPTCKIYRATATSIANNSWVSVPFDTEAWDTHNMHDNSTNNSRITIPAGQDGTYIISGQIQFALNASGGRGVRFKFNGNSNSTDPKDDGNGIFDVSQGSYEWRRNITGIRTMVAGDYVELEVYQGSGGALNANADTTQYQMGTALSVVRVGA